MEALDPKTDRKGKGRAPEPKVQIDEASPKQTDGVKDQLIFQINHDEAYGRELAGTPEALSQEQILAIARSRVPQQVRRR